MPDMKDLDLDITSNTGAEAATEDDFSDLLSTVISATESGDPAPKSHDVTIPVPNKTEITAEQYNKAKDQLIRTLKESADLLAELEQTPIVETAELSLDEQQAAYTEAVELDAIYRSYLAGPYFEAVRSRNKDGIVTAVNAIKKASRSTRTDKYGLEVFKLMPEDIRPQVIISENPYEVIASTLFHTIVGTVAKAVNRSVIKKLILTSLKDNPTIKAKAWQTVGSFYAKESELSDALEYYSDLFEEPLSGGDLKLEAIKLKASFVTKQRNFYGYCYLLIVADKSSSKSEDITIDIDETKDKK